MKRDFPKHRLPPLEITRPSDPHHHGHPHPIRPPPGHRQPVIIHTYSPEVIPVDSDNFRQLVQRLTGPGSHTPPPRKRARFVEPPPSNPNRPDACQIAPLFRPAISPRARLPAPAYPGEALPHNPLLSPSLFEVSPTVLPSPPAYFSDYASIVSPRGARGPAAGLLGPSPRGVSTTPRSLAAALPSPGPLTMSFLADLPALSPAGYSWVGGPAEPILGSRPGLPPRPHSTITANLFPQTPPAALGYYEEDEKPFLPYRERQR